MNFSAYWYKRLFLLSPAFKKRIILRIKLIAIVSLAACMHIYAKGFSQNVSISRNNISLEKLFKKLQDQSGYIFWYESKLLDGRPGVNVHLKDVGLESALGIILEELPLTYQIVDNAVIIKEKKDSGLKPQSLEHGNEKDVVQMPVSGTVRSEQGELLPGVSVVVKDSKQGTMTDEMGAFSLSVTGDDVTLVFSSIGYRTTEVELGNRTNIDVTLYADVQQLNEIVVVGYGTAQKKDLTGSVVRANVEEFRESPNISILQSLQGTVPGLNVGAITRAGTNPGMTIRGRTSISGSNTPLVILDGIIYRGNLVDINPNDIESVDILKDASAAAIYGSQASNGVVILTSKTGKGYRKPIVEYNVSYTRQEVSNKAMLPEDGAGFIRKIGDRFLTESRIGDDMLTMNPEWDPTTQFFGTEILEGYQNGVETNWWKLLTKEHPYIQNHNVSVGGKSEFSSYFFSLGYTDQQNVVLNDTYERYSFRVNLESNVSDWFKVGIQSFLSLNDYSGVSPSIENIVGMPPQASYVDENGEYILQPYRGILNPFLQMDQEDLDRRSNLFGNIYANIDVPFIKGLSYRFNLSQNSIVGKSFNFNPYAQNFTGTGSKSNSSQYLMTADNILSYQRTFGDHSVNGTLVYGVEKRTFESTTARSTLYDNPVLGYNNLSAGQAGLHVANSSGWKETSLYTMLRLGYIYKDKYIFTGTVRRDGFSGFGEDNKFGVFPSAAVAWRLSEEEFLKSNAPSVDDLKLRISYGLNGNRTVGRYQTLAKTESSVALGYLFGDGADAEFGQQISSLANSELKWESTKSLNVGLDFALLHNRLHGSVEVYWANTFDLLYNINIPEINGFTNTPMNIGKLGNWGQELSLTGSPLRNTNLKWDVTVNFSRNRNKVLSILGLDNDGDGKEDDLISSKIFIGHPYGVAYDFNITGMWQLEDYHAGTIPDGFTYGTYKVEDINGDGAYTADADRKIIGYSDPSHRFSVMNNVRYKGWELRFFINSIQGGKKYYYGKPGGSLPNPDNIYKSNMFNFDYWTPENPDARYRQLGYYTVAMGAGFSPYIQRSFVRLQDVTLAYNLPTNLLGKVKISQAKVFINGKNLLTFSDWDGWDPETGTGLNPDAYPLLRGYSIGLNVQF